MGIAALRAALMVAAALAFFHAMPAASGSARAHGRELVMHLDLPGDAVGRYAARAAAASGNATAGEPAPLIDNAMWVGPLQQVGVGRNPYTMVLTVNGVARAAGDIGSRWQTGWEVRESPAATREVLMSVGARIDAGTQAGAPVTLTAVSAPLSFRGERHASPLLNLVHADNLDIRDVNLQIWSGSAPLLAWPSLAAPRPPLLALGALCLLMALFLRRTARPLAAPRALNSRLPQSDVVAPTESPADTDRAAAPLLQPARTAAAQSESARVVNTLRDVLMRGLAVPTELDERRRRNAR